MSSALIDKLVEQVNPAASGVGLTIVICVLTHRIVWQAICAVFNRLTDHDVRLIKANADAEATRVRAEAEAQATILTARANAKKQSAEADLIRAMAATKRAEAERLQKLISRLNDLCKKLNARGIDWRAEVGEDGHMRVVATNQVPAGRNTKAVRKL